jgi:leucyl-tRNA synthetase
MVFVNALEKEPVVPRGVFETFLRLLAPFAPFFVEEMWEKTGHTTSVHKEAWPSYDEKVLDAEEVIIVLQVNGKTRSTLSLPRGVSQDEVSRLAQKDETVARHLGDVSIKKEIFVPDRLWNAVV